MLPRDPNACRDRVLEHFSEPPKLTFDNQHSNDPIKLRFPTLNRPARHYRIGSRPHGDTKSGRSSTSQLGLSTNVLFDCFYKGTSKLRYGQIPANDWEKYLRFAADRLVSTSGRRFGVLENKAIDTWDGKPDTPINLSREAANDWFLNHLLPNLEEGNNGAVHYLVGKPGCGKSTLFKYLLLRNNERLRQNRFVFSRFELMKYMRDHAPNNRSFDEGLTREEIQRTLEEFISLILLRDLIQSRFYVLADWKTPRIYQLDGSDTQVRDDIRAIAEEAGLSAEKLEIVDRAVGKDYFYWKTLRNLSGVERTRLVSILARNRRLVLVLDGLDHITITDTYAVTERHRIVKYILGHLNTITNLSLLGGYDGAKIRTIQIIRNLTLLQVHTGTEKRDTDELSSPGREHNQIFHIQEIDARVATYNSIKRSVEFWLQGKIVDEDTPKILEVTNFLMSAIDSSFKIIKRSTQYKGPYSDLYEIFGGNIRTLVHYMDKLFSWFAWDAADLIAPEKQREIGPQQLLEAFCGPDGFAHLNRRRYRLIELLLFSYRVMPWFENRTKLESLDPISNQVAGGTISRDDPLSDNEYYTGIVDNVFNHHIARHSPHPDIHCFLEGLRIVQSVADTPMSFEEMEEKLRDDFGYSAQGFKETLNILLRSDFLGAIPFGNGLKFSSTFKGRFVSDFLCKQMSYVEHVFHQTYYPGDLLPNVDDRHREADIGEWTIQSIRNCFVHLTYLKWVENNPARGRHVPDVYRIYNQSQKRIRNTVERILEDQIRDNATLSGKEGHPTRRVLGEIEDCMSTWRRNGVVA